MAKSSCMRVDISEIEHIANTKRTTSDTISMPQCAQVSIDTFSTGVSNPAKKPSCQEGAKVIRKLTKMNRGRSTSFSSIEAEIISYCDAGDAEVNEPLTPSTVESSSWSCSPLQMPSAEPRCGPISICMDQCLHETDDDDGDEAECDRFLAAAETRLIRRTATPRIDDGSYLEVQPMPTPTRSGLWQRRNMLLMTATSSEESATP